MNHQGESPQMLQPTCQSRQPPPRQPSLIELRLAKGSSSENSELSEQKPIGLFFVSSISAEANLVWWGYERALRADTRLADLSLSLFISCLACNHPVSAKAATWLVQCRINILARIQAWSVGSLILSDSSCITETILIAFLTEGCLKVVDEGMGLYHRCDLSDALRIDLGWGWLINGVLLLLVRSTRIGFSQLLFLILSFQSLVKL